MPSRLTRSFLAGSAFVLGAALIAAGASTIDDDVPDRGEQVEIVAAELALELQRLCPPASPSDQAAFDRCRRDLFGDSALGVTSRRGFCGAVVTRTPARRSKTLTSR